LKSAVCFGQAAWPSRLAMFCIDPERAGIIKGSGDKRYGRVRGFMRQQVLTIAGLLICVGGCSGPAAPKKATIVPAGQDFKCTPIRVWDGDGPVWCAEGPRVRLSGIAAREMDGTCRSNQPCPNAAAKDAKNALVSLLGGARGRLEDGHVIVGGPRLSCRSVGPAGGTRTAAWCTSAQTGDVSCAMVKTGTVLRWQRYWRDHRC
jgi:endonuclease YncB( thermonuclease family)